MESTIEYLQRELRAAGPGAWDEIAEKVTKNLARQGLTEDRHKVTRITLRKIAYGERSNLGTVKSDALRAYFQREKARA
jgi:hypothetical protein